MRNLKYIFLLLPLFSFGQFPDLLGLSSWQHDNATPSNLYTTANAANPTETNAATGFSLISGSATIESSNTGATPTNGSYFLKSIHTGAANTGPIFRETITGFIIGHTYSISFDVNRIARPSGSGNASIIVQNSSASQLDTTGNLSTSSGWNNFVLEFTADTTSIFLNIVYGGTADPGDTIGLDNIIILDTTP